MSVKNKLLRITAAAAAAAIIASSFSACGEDTIYIGSTGGKDIASGIYIYALLGAYSEAMGKMTETDTDVFAITIDGKNAADWMIDKAKNDVKQYAVIEKKFDEYGLSLTEDESSAAKIYVDSLWEYYGAVYEEYGISKDSFLKCYRNTIKSDKVFEHVYGAEGERCVESSEIYSYMEENYSLVNYISMNLVDGDGNLLKSAGKAEMLEKAKDYAERAKNGEDFDKLNSEYISYFDSLKSEAASASENDENSSEAGSGFEMSVVPSDAETMSGDDDTGEVTAAPDEEVTTLYTDADIDALLGNDSAAADASEEAPVYDDEVIAAADDYFASQLSNKKIIQKDGDIPDKTVCDKVFNEMNVGDITVIEEDEYYYVVYKMDIGEDLTYFLNAEASLLREMKQDDYTALCEEWANSLDFSFVDASVARYTPQKFAEAEKNAS